MKKTYILLLNIDTYEDIKSYHILAGHNIEKIEEIAKKLADEKTDFHNDWTNERKNLFKENNFTSGIMSLDLKNKCKDLENEVYTRYPTLEKYAKDIVPSYEYDEEWQKVDFEIIEVNCLGEDDE